MKGVISLDEVIDNESLKNLVVHTNYYRIGRLQDHQVHEETPFLFMERLYRGDLGKLPEASLVVLFKKLPRSYVTASFEGDNKNAVIWAIKNHKYSLLQELLLILSDLYVSNQSLMQKDEVDNYWGMVFAGTTIRHDDTELEIVKEALKFAIEDRIGTAISKLLDTECILCEELSRYSIAVTIESREGLVSLKDMLAHYYREIDFPATALALALRPELVEELLQPRYYSVASQLLTKRLVACKEFDSYAFTPSQIRRISLFSKDLADYIIDHKLSTYYAVLDGICRCDMSMLRRMYFKTKEVKRQPLGSHHINGNRGNIIVRQPRSVVLGCQFKSTQGSDPC